jgi:hypothetical protein
LGLVVKVVAWVLVTVGAYLILVNYWALAANYRNLGKGIDRHHSFVPFLGGLIGAVGTYLLVQDALAFAVAAVDPGVWVMAWLPIALLRQAGRRTKR